MVAEDSGIVDAARAIEALRASAEAVQLDLTAPGSIDLLCGVIASRSQPLDALVINAGVGVGGRFLETDLQQELRMIQLNVCSAVRLAKRLLPDMAARRKGRVLLTSSIAGIMPAPFEAVYGAIKAFLLSGDARQFFELAELVPRARMLTCHSRGASCMKIRPSC